MLLLFSSVALADINLDYHEILTGNTPVSPDHIDEMYGQFNAEFKDLSGFSASSHYKKSNLDRKSVFANKVQEIIKHNLNPAKSFQKGINEYSDMTESEFFDHFNLINAEQHCSAT